MTAKRVRCLSAARGGRVTRDVSQHEFARFNVRGPRPLRTRTAPDVAGQTTREWLEPFAMLSSVLDAPPAPGPFL